MAQSPVDLQKARAELELLKQRERELEERLGLHSNETKQKNDQLEKRQNFNKIIYIDINKPQDNYDKKIRDRQNSISRSPRSPPLITSHPPSGLLNIDEETGTDITENESVTLNLQEEINYDDDTDEYEGDSLTDEIQETTREVVTVENNEGETGLTNGYHSDNESQETDNNNELIIDQRDKIRKDIKENQERELELQYKRGSIENIADYFDEESDSEVSEMVQREDIRDKILREIENEKLRDLEIQAKHRQEGFEIEDDHDTFDKTQVLPSPKDPKTLLEEELRELANRENELHQHDDGYHRNRMDTRKSSVIEKDSRGKIEKELEEQREREIEMVNLRKSLSQNNLFQIEELNLEDDEISIVENELNIRDKILQELEEQKQREYELKKKTKLTSQQNNLMTQSNGYDTNESEDESEVDFMKNENINMRQKIEYEMSQSMEREKELKYKNKTSNPEMILKNAVNENISKSKHLSASKENLDLLMKPLNKKFGSREDLVSFFGCPATDEVDAKFNTSIDEKLKEKRAMQSVISRVQIPKVFGNAQKVIKLNIESKIKNENSQNNEHHIEKKVKSEPKVLYNGQIKVQSETVKTDIPSKTKSNQSSNSLYVDQNKKQETKKMKKKSTNPFKKSNSPRKNNKNPFLTDTTDNGGTQLKNGYSNGVDISKEQLKNLSTLLPTDDEKIKTKAMLSNSRNPFNIAILAEQWERKTTQDTMITKHERMNVESDDLKQRKEDVKLRQVKRKSLEFLWHAQKPIVTVDDDNSDKDDTDLLTNVKEIQQDFKSRAGTSEKAINKQQATTTIPPPPPTLALNKTIRKWEKRIAKHSKDIERVYYV